MTVCHVYGIVWCTLGLFVNCTRTTASCTTKSWRVYVYALLHTRHHTARKAHIALRPGPTVAVAILIFAYFVGGTVTGASIHT